MQNLLKDRLIVISGFGRSGTTILGKVLGSMQPSVYCFEPPVMKYLAEFGLSDIPAKLLFESHFLQEFQGRGNMNSNDWSYSGNYIPISTIEVRRDTLRRREDAIRLLEGSGYKFILKGTELQYQFDMMDVLFPGVKFVHIIRNGFDSIRSTMKRGWYTDDYCNNAVVEDMMPHFKCDIPYFVDQDAVKQWPDWNPATRAACAWRSATTSGIRYKHENPENCIQIKYEGFVFEPQKYADYFERKLGLRQSDLTKQHIDSIELRYNLCTVRDYTSDIAEPERSKFLRLNKKLGYETY